MSAELLQARQQRLQSKLAAARARAREEARVEKFEGHTTERKAACWSFLKEQWITERYDRRLAPDPASEGRLVAMYYRKDLVDERRAELKALARADVEEDALEHVTADLVDNELRNAFNLEDAFDVVHRAKMVDKFVGRLKDKFQATQLQNSVVEKAAAERADTGAGIAPNLDKVRVLFDYDSEDEETLTMVAESEVVVTDRSDGEWWAGYNPCNPGKVGFFPANFVASLGDDGKNNPTTVGAETSDSFIGPSDGGGGDTDFAGAGAGAGADATGDDGDAVAGDAAPRPC